MLNFLFSNTEALLFNACTAASGKTLNWEESYYMIGAPYLHMLEGRMRIKVPEVKKSPLKAVQVEETLQRLDGVTDVRANPTTGNVLVLFESETVTHGRIVDVLRSLNCFKAQDQTTGTPRRIHEFIVRSVAELAFERMLVALL
jgi:copper chaperone CopZ